MSIKYDSKREPLAEIIKILSSPDSREKLESLGYEPIGNTPAQAAAAASEADKRHAADKREADKKEAERREVEKQREAERRELAEKAAEKRERERAAAEQAAKAAAAAAAKPKDDTQRARALLEGKASEPTAGRFVVQVGAFADADAVREARAKVEKLGLKTYTQVVETSGGKRTRVRVGPFSTRDEADKASSKMRSAGLAPAVLTL